MRRIFWIYITSYRTSVEQSKYIKQSNFFPWFKYKSYWHWYSYHRLRQTRCIRISYRQFPWLSGDVPRLPPYCVYVSQFARCCTSVSDLNSKNLQLTSKLLTQGYRYHKLRKTFGRFFRSYSDLLYKFGEISFQENVTEGNFSSGFLRWSRLQTKEGQRWSEFRLIGLLNSQTPLTSKVWPIDHREDDRFCAWPFYSLEQIFPEALHSD